MTPTLTDEQPRCARRGYGTRLVETTATGFLWVAIVDGKILTATNGQDHKFDNARAAYDVAFEEACRP